QVIPTIEKDGEVYPSDIAKNGWLFDPASGNTVVAKYLFGKTVEVTKNDLKFNIANTTLSTEKITETPTDNSVYILIGIGVAAAVTIVWYLKNIRSKN
ncbi:MAG: hypothetical protein HZA82_03585, partial [Thaumarchaeota archaeon]|nr:hypothetical protein [Nitrososphaerota archaeon]